VFTGIVAAIGRFEGLRTAGPGRRMAFTGILGGEPLALGESIAVNGVCLTVDAFDSKGFEADVSPESLSRTNLGRLRPGAEVNLERALRPIDRLGGHFVSGHIDAVGKLLTRRREGEFELLTFSAPEGVRRYLVEKGSVAVDGVSLTVAGLTSEGFTIAVIPHTLARTTLASLPAGGEVNLEADILAKYIEKLAGGKKAEGLTFESLAKSGFIR
jgi:riboflavin synthase